VDYKTAAATFKRNALKGRDLAVAVKSATEAAGAVEAGGNGQPTMESGV
jgi:hypothetical protein